MKIFTNIVDNLATDRGERGWGGARVPDFRGHTGAEGKFLGSLGQ